MNKTTPFDKLSRAQMAFDSLADDYDNNHRRIIDSLSLFVRHAINDQAKTWNGLINHHDLIVRVVMSTNAAFQELGGGVTARLSLLEDGPETIAVTPHDFLNVTVIDSNESRVTIQRLIDAVSYNGTTHFLPDDKSLLPIYTNIVVRHDRVVFEILRQIAKCLIDAYRPIRDYERGCTNRINSYHNHSPIICSQGVPEVFPDGYLAALYRGAWVQIPVQGRPERGLRVCLDMQLVDSQGSGVLFSMGDRRLKGINLKLRYDSSSVVLDIANADARVPSQHIDRGLFAAGRVAVIEVCVDPLGRGVVAIDGWHKLSFSVHGQVEVPHGKFVLGADLNGKKNGWFRNRQLELSEVAADGRVIPFHRSSDAQRLPPSRNVVVENLLLYRPTFC